MNTSFERSANTTDEWYTPKEIVDAYRANGFNSMFIRSLNPYGLAKDNDDWPLYFDRFIDLHII